MFAEYKRDVSHNYLILHGDETINTTSYQVRILTGNTMSSILKCRMQGLDGTWLFYMISLQSSRWHLFTNSVNYREKIWK